MCMGCMGHADFLATSGILGVASLRVGLRRFLPAAPWRTHKVTDAEASAFVASLAPTPGDAAVGILDPADRCPAPTDATTDLPGGLAPTTVAALEDEPSPLTPRPVDDRITSTSGPDRSQLGDAPVSAQVLAAR